MRSLGQPLIVTLLTLVLLPCLAWGDSLQLRDGRHFDGHYVGGTESMVAFFTSGTVAYFPVTEVLLVVFGQGTGPGSLATPSGLPSPAVKPMTSTAPHKTVGHNRRVASRASQKGRQKPVLRTVAADPDLL
jgi:hypothetical protein